MNTLTLVYDNKDIDEFIAIFLPVL